MKTVRKLSLSDRSCFLGVYGNNGKGCRSIKVCRAVWLQTSKEKQVSLVGSKLIRLGNAKAPMLSTLECIDKVVGVVNY